MYQLKSIINTFKRKTFGGNQVQNNRKIRLSPLIIILHDYQAIYFSIPKVASSTWHRICATLLEFNLSETELKNELRVKGLPYIEKHEVSHYGDYFKFCFVRNPFDRLVSCYSNKINKDPNYNEKGFKNGVHKVFLKYGDLFRGGMTFEEFAKAIAEIPDADSDRHFRSQHTFITDKKGNKIVNFVGKIENSREDFYYVLTKLRKTDIAIPHFKKSLHGISYQDFYTQETIYAVRKRYLEDLEIFEYDF